MLLQKNVRTNELKLVFSVDNSGDPRYLRPYDSIHNFDFHEL